MATTKSPAKPTEAVKQITYLASALKAPRITEAASRLGVGRNTLTRKLGARRQRG